MQTNYPIRIDEIVFDWIKGRDGNIWFLGCKGFKLNEYGLFDRDTNEYLGGATEEEIYDLLGRTYKPPEMRAESVKDLKSKAPATVYGNPVYGVLVNDDGIIQYMDNSFHKGADGSRDESIQASVDFLNRPGAKYEGTNVKFIRFEDGVTFSDMQFSWASEEGQPVMRPMEFGEPVNWTPFDGTPSLKRRRDAESSVSSDADLFWLWLCDEDLVFHRLLARMYRSKNFGFLREPGQRNPETFDFSYYGYNEGHFEYLLDNSLLSLEEQNEEALDNISFQLAQKMMNWVEMASNDIGMPDWTSEEMVVAVDLGNTYAEDMVYLIFPDGSEMQMETFNVVKGYPMYDETYSREIIVPQRKKQIGGVKVPIARIPIDESSDSMQFIWSGELKVVAINDREPYSFKDGQV